jgi:hypothetical protein
LEGYIAHIMGNEIKLLWRRGGRDRRIEMPTELEDSRNFALDIEAKHHTRRLIEKSPKHLWWYIEAIVDADEYLSERDAAEIGKVTRYKVGILREELRRIWESMEPEPEPTEQAEENEEVELTKRAKAGTSGD